MPSTTEGLPHGTGASGLSDDELLLLDALFSRPAQRMNLQQAWYSIQNSVSYTHSLDDDALVAKLDEWVRLGLLSCSHGQRTRDQWSMTAQAGQLWESEREPPWQGFCSPTFNNRGDEPEEISVFRVRAFCEVPIHAIINDLQCNPNSAWELADPLNALLIEPCGEPLLYWKTAPTLEGRIRIRRNKNHGSGRTIERPPTFWLRFSEMSGYRGDAHS